MRQRVGIQAVSASLTVLLLILLLFCPEISAAGPGERFVFVRDGTVWTASTRGGSEKQITFSRQDRDPAMSPDGKWVAYVSGADEISGLGQLYLIPAEGGPAKRFSLRNVQGAAQPSFSPDGRNLIFVSISGLKALGTGDDTLSFANVSLVAIDLATFKSQVVATTQDVLIDSGHVYAWPAIAPDGRLTVYHEHSLDISGGIEAIEPGGKVVFAFPPNPQDPTPYWRPRFDGDGANILCFSPSAAGPGKGIIYLVNVQKGTKKRITEGSNPTFVSQGRSIVFEREATTPRTGTQTDLYALELWPGAQAKKIVSGGALPAGKAFAR